MTVRAMTEQEMLKALEGAGVGSKVFVSYIAGRKNGSLKARLERRRAEVEGISLRHFTGTLESLKRNKSQETYMLLYALERDTVRDDGETTEGNYRAFNPSLGQMLVVEILDPVRDCWFAL